MPVSQSVPQAGPSRKPTRAHVVVSNGKNELLVADGEGDDNADADAESNAEGTLTPAPTSFHDSSQFRHWRYSRDRLRSLRGELNEKSKEVTSRNMAAEKEAQASLGHAFTEPSGPSTYLSVEDELLLVRFYCAQVSKICRQGFGLPEAVEATAISYVKRFYLKNSVMEWHPKSIMPTCLFLAAKTTNHPVPIDVFVSKLPKFTPSDVLDLEFLVAQSLSFEFWVRGAEKALRGWSLELQSQPSRTPIIDAIQRSTPGALDHLSASRLTDAEFLYSPSQIALACFRLANTDLVDNFLEWKYQSAAIPQPGENVSSAGHISTLPYGIEREDLLSIIAEIEHLIQEGGAGEMELKRVKEVDKKLKSCTNPEKVPGTALYIMRKAEQENKAAEAKAAKSLKAQIARSSDELVFGNVIDIPLGSKSSNGGQGLGDPFGP